MASSKYMQALLAVLASGTRRKPVYIRQQALVSKLYPNVFTDTINVGASLFEFSTQVTAKSFASEDAVGVAASLYLFEVRQPVYDYFGNDAVSVTSSVFMFEVKQPVIQKTFDDSVAVTSSVHSFIVDAIGLPYQLDAEAVVVTSSLFEFSVGVT